MTRFSVWAPAARREAWLSLPDREVAMTRDGGRGWWSVEVAGLDDGADYGFRLDDSPDVLPDPRSRRQPHGVHGRSRTVDPRRFHWTDQGWPGRALPGSVIYELHIGTFTPGGTFDAAIERLPDLVALGVDAVELLPVAATAGARNWGYDGVDLYAVTENYGGPDGLVRFVDAAHGAGIAVLLDVVYNHLGPSGNYLDRFGPYFGASSTDWGQAVNLDEPGSDEVRRFVVDNALMWLRDYHLDGLRLDAVHALRDTRATHLLEELAAAVDALAVRLGRPLWLIAESDLNDPRLIRERTRGGYGLTAQWTDDIHHALHAALTGERQGYYVDYGPLSVLAKALTDAFVLDGGWSHFRGRSHGRPTGDLPGSRFVACLQNHDQIGNRARGDRLAALLEPAQLKVAAALLLCSPYTVLLFMGEEWGAGTPWQFFCDPDSAALARATRDGRRREFAQHGWEPGDVPDPVALSTFEASRLVWSERDRDPHREIRDWYAQLIALRRAEPCLRDDRRARTRVDYDEAARWLVLVRDRVVLVANLGPEPVQVPIAATPVEVLASSEPGFAYGDRSVSLRGRSALMLRTL
ncbi:MAG TPA: malto-oligosyltrehalose trehalohydrolase [Mycobacteriales bacterium]|jgi:maltooligosyltrehalose trehalohydrolase|nr:malto-oligosyltrehalose trehalohydrolase [Mycobacteriales bacterium]